MGRAPVAVFVAVLLCVALLPVRSHLTESREVIASTPSSYTGLTEPIPIPPGGEACADQILYDPNAEVAHFGVSSAVAAPALEVAARGDKEGEYRSDYASETVVDGGWRGTRELAVPLEPPDESTFGTFCVTNLGSRPVDLLGTQNGRAYSRPTVTVNGEQNVLDLQLRLTEAEHRSVLDRAGQAAGHAATLKPFGAWWMWLLGVALVAATPLGVVFAMRSALAADEAANLARERAPAMRFPVPAAARRMAALPGWAIVTAAAALAVVWFLYWGWHTHVFQHDEDQYVYLSRWLQQDLPASLWSFDLYGRGLQRLEVWLLAIPSALFDSPWSLIGGRFLNTLAFVSTSIPVYLLGRGMGLRSHWAALPAVLTAVVPWAVVTTSFLTENVAYPACLWAIWAIWRAAAAPGPWRDLLALVLLVVAGAARSGLLLLAPVLPVVVVLTGLRYGTGSVLARLRALLRQHAVLWIAVGGAALVLVAGAAGVGSFDGVARRLAGGYATPFGFDPVTLINKFGRYVSRTVVGTGFLAAAVGLPWLAVQLVRPRGPARFAFALTLVVSALALLYSLNAAGPDERYIVYLAPLVLLPATLAVAHREVSPLGLAIGSVLVALLVLRVPWEPEQGPFAFFVSPVEMFYSRAVGLRLSTYLPGDGDDALTFFTLLMGAVGVTLAALLRWAPAFVRGAPAVLLVAGVAVVIPIQTQYTMTKYVNGAGSKAAAGLRERAFADRMVPDGATVAEFTEGVGQRPEFFSLWQEVQFYNERIDTVYTLGDLVNPVPPGDDVVSGVGFDPRTGRITSPRPLPDYLVVPTQVGAVRVRGEIVAAPSYIAVALLKVAQPATAAWRATGFEPYGVVPADGDGVIRFYGTGLDPGIHCASLLLAAPADRQARWTVERDGSRVDAGQVDPGQPRSVAVELPRLVERGFVDVKVGGGSPQVQGIGVDEGC